MRPQVRTARSALKIVKLWKRRARLGAMVTLGATELRVLQNALEQYIAILPVEDNKEWLKVFDLYD